MRTTLDIPDVLMAEVQRLSGHKSKTGAIVTAMEEYVLRQKMEGLLALEGKLQMEGYDWEREEELEILADEEKLASAAIIL